jgi:uncharacterized protein
MSKIYYTMSRSMAHTLDSMSELLSKIPDFVAKKGISDETVFKATLAPDMFPFIKQVQLMSDVSKGFASRLTQVDNPSMPDEEKSVEELIDRLKKTAAFIRTFDEEDFDDVDEVKVTMPFLPGKYMEADEYATKFATPNFYFHTTIAYAILRHLGMSIGKVDYLGQIELLDL